MNDLSLGFSDNYFFTVYADDTSVCWGKHEMDLRNKVATLSEVAKLLFEKSNLKVNFVKLN